MDPVVTIKITGLKELQQKLEQLPKKVGQNIFRKGLKAAGKLFVDAMVNFAPKDTGFLSEHFGMRLKILKENIAGTAYIGLEGKIDYPDVGGGYRDKVNKKGQTHKVGRISVASVTRFLEFGTVHEKKVPFMTQAYEQQKKAAVDEVIKSIKEALNLESK